MPETTDRLRPMPVLDNTKRVWDCMRARCYNENNPEFKRYGGRGIIVCDQWRYSAKQFRQDMGCRPSREHSIDRIDVNGPYSPENCRWVTMRDQARNKRNNRILTHDGRSQCVAAWADELGVNVQTLHSFLRRGDTIQAAVQRYGLPTASAAEYACAHGTHHSGLCSATTINTMAT